MDLIGTILWPLKWVIEVVLVFFHLLFSWLGMDPNGGLTWTLSIVGLVVVVRSTLIPLVVRQVHSSRQMMEIQPLLKKLNEKYKGKRDQFSLQAKREETAKLYRENGVNPLGSCLPLISNLLVGWALFQVIQEAQQQHAGVGLLTLNLSESFAKSNLFGAPLSGSFLTQWQNMTEGRPFELEVLLLAAALVVAMTVLQFITQLQLVSKNMSAAVKESPMYRQQRMMLYFLPLALAGSGVVFPLGVLLYWSVSNLWTMGQQWMIIRRMPTPGSEAAKAREERLARQGKLPATPNEVAGATDAKTQGQVTQRRQPVSKSRRKKQGGKR